MPRAGLASAPARVTRSGRRSGTSAAERYIAGVPARIMRPRLVFIACLAALVSFGVLMVYSASSVEAANTYGSATFFVMRQAIFAVLGLIGILVIIHAPDKYLDEAHLWAYNVLMVLLLVAVALVGRGSRGATRWLNLGFMQFQPSEFLKLVIIPLVALLFENLYSDRVPDTRLFIKKMGIALVPSLVLIFLQPDFGTVIILVLTVFAMALFANIRKETALGILAAIGLLCLLALAVEPYRITRLLVAGDPWADEFGDGYQATLAIMAFASGGLFGRGIGNSTMKYSYLPEAHNDYILAIIGEEVGFVGTLLLFIVFALLIWSAFKIAEQATNRRGALIASGCAVVLAVQFLINALGILNVIGMTGKPLPFISYGGSSMIVSLCLAGLILRVSHESARKDQYERRRESFAVYDESTAGEAHVRGARSRDGFSVYDGTGVSRASGSRAATPRQPGSGPTRTVRTNARGYDRIDLNSDPSARLRTDDEGPRVRRDYHDR